MPKRKKRKDSKMSLASNYGVDRISALPESILTHILSLLPAEDAVATGILSTNWKLLWKNIYNLSFNDGSRRFTGHCTRHQNRTKFAFAVNKILISLNEQCIEKFSLHIETNSNLYDVMSWLSVAISRNAKVIEFKEKYRTDPEYCINSDDDDCIEIPYDYIEIPGSLFTSKTLEVLCISSPSLCVNLPSLVCLPNLKSLHLEFVYYKCDDSVRKFISGCSSLETLHVFRNYYDNVVIFTIYSPTLTNLTLKCFDGDVETFPTFDHDYKLEVDAPRLRYLRLKDYVSTDFSLENLCLLDVAEIRVEQLYDRDLPENNLHYSEAVVKLCHGLYNVKNLSLMVDDEMEVLSCASVSTSFMRLSRLDLHIKCWKELLNFIEGSKKLEFLTLTSKDNCDKSTHDTCWNKPEKVPICLLSSLKTVSLKEIKAGAVELAMIAYILKNAKVLRTMTIQPAFSWDNNKHELQLLQEVPKFPRGSEECQLHFLNPVRLLSDHWEL